MLIGNRKLCRYIVNTSPGTAIALFSAMEKQKKYDTPISQFSKNIITEALSNKDSILYHEDAGYYSGLLGYLKPFSRTIFGNYPLVEALASKNGSPLDVHHELTRNWDASQLSAYCRCAGITFESYLQNNAWPAHSYALFRAISNIKESCRDLYKMNDYDDPYKIEDVSNRLHVVVQFITDTINLFEQHKTYPLDKKKQEQSNFYDYIADMMLEIILFASSVKSSPQKCWSIQYASVWDPFFCSAYSNQKAWKIIHYKLCRLLYEEICKLEKFPNFKSSAILSLCLNVMGIQLPSKDRVLHGTYYSLHKLILSWVKMHYLALWNANQNVAESCLIDGISFDIANSKIVKTHTSGLLQPKQVTVFIKLNN